MNLERIRHAAISNAKEHDKWAVVCTDGDYEYARTKDEALVIMESFTEMRETVAPENRYDYGLVRVDIEP